MSLNPQAGDGAESFHEAGDGLVFDPGLVEALTATHTESHIPK